MEDKILGLHHITAIAAHAQHNYDFYTKVLGLRLVKRRSILMQLKLQILSIL
jgi:glyoxalase family protein